MADDRSGSTKELLIPLHIRYITALASHTNSLTYHLTTHLRLNAIYWALTALFLFRAPDALLKEDVVAYVLSCFDERQGGFGAHPRHDAHILATLSALQILFMYDRLAESLDAGKRERITIYILSLQNPQTGEFAGDSTKLEYDNRFLYCAVSSLALLSTCTSKGEQGQPTDDESVEIYDPLTRLDRSRTVDAVLACHNFDGGFGRIAGSESHASQSFVCIGALRILGAVERLNQQDRRKRHERWLSERQLPNGGLNGRPQKLEDVCYSWWVLSALAMLGRLHWIDGNALAAFILSAQDPDNGGIADRPDNVADVFHTNFGAAGLSILGAPHNKGLDHIDPVYCLPANVVARTPHLIRQYQRMADDA